MLFAQMTSLFLSFGYITEEGSQYQPRSTQINSRFPPGKDSDRVLTSTRFLRGRQLCRDFHLRVTSVKAPPTLEIREQNSSADWEEISAVEIRLNSFLDSEDDSRDKDLKESQRRRRIGLANKGKVPWNKGRKHTEETRERIRQRTIEAMRDPKVRKKMSECPRSLSNQTKARIGSSLRQLWGKRLKSKRSSEKIFSSWAESIAEAAKKGGPGQEQLDWDSYDSMKREIAAQQLQWAAEKAKAKEMARLRAERAAQSRVRLAQKREVQERRVKGTGQTKRKPRKKSKEEKEDLAVCQELKLKERLRKLRRKISVNSQVTSQRHRVWDILDPEQMRRERTEIPLADQIRSIKKKKAEFVFMRALTTSSATYQSSESLSGRV